jgi:hypothetical protein
MTMKVIFASACLLTLTFVSPAEAKGCIKGAIVGGVAGHMAGHAGRLGLIRLTSTCCADPVAERTKRSMADWRL